MKEGNAVFALRKTAIPGCVELQPRMHTDIRGRFVKSYHAESFAELGLPFSLAEAFVSTSRRDVVRGLHFQTPPHDHVKLVQCVAGEAFDVVVDLRVGSPAFGEHICCSLSGESGNLLYIPKGCAHGFCASSDSATLLYLVSSSHAPASDAGIRWDSAGIRWPTAAPVLSPRDAALPTLAEFTSPFRYPGAP